MAARGPLDPVVLVRIQVPVRGPIVCSMSNFDLAVGSINASVFTSPHATTDLDPEVALLAAIGGAKRTLYFGVYSFTLVAVADAIIAAHKRGVQVIGVADTIASSGINNQVHRVAAAGVPVTLWGGQWRLMHEKAFVVDHNYVGLGSYNWTTQAEKNNVEILLTAKGRQVSRVLAPTMEKQIQAAHDAGKPIT